MSKASSKLGRSFRTALFGAALMPALALGLTSLSASEAQAANYEGANCQVHAVLANKDGDGVLPESLKFLAAELGSPAFGIFKSFVLLGTQRLALKKGTEVTQKLASGHPISLALRAADDTQIKLHVKLGQANGKSLVDTDYSVRPDGFVLFAASHKKGSVIFAVQCHGK